MNKPRLVRHHVGPGPNDYVLIKKTGVEGCRFIKKLKEVFPNRLFLDPYNKSGLKNLIYIAAGASGTARVYVRQYGPGGKLEGVFQPVRLKRNGNLRADVLTWVRCLWEVYDLELPLPLFDVEYDIHCMNAADKMTALEAKQAIRWVTELYKKEGRG
jgi:hypothetical protein